MEGKGEAMYEDLYLPWEDTQTNCVWAALAYAPF